jgi:hypothetical protein
MGVVLRVALCLSQEPSDDRLPAPSSRLRRRRYCLELQTTQIDELLRFSGSASRVHACAKETTSFREEQIAIARPVSPISAIEIEHDVAVRIDDAMLHHIPGAVDFLDAGE